MNKFILGLVLGVAVSVSGSVFALTLKPYTTQVKNILETQTGVLLKDQKLSAQEQIDLGYKYDQYTGKKLVAPELSETEKRFRDIEARLQKLEKKK